MKTEKRNLPCKLTNEERAQKAQIMTRASEEHDRLEHDLKRIKAQYNGDMELQQAEFFAARQMVSSGIEYRDILCEVTPDLEKRNMIITRPDTCEHVSVRPMVAAEIDLYFKPLLPGVEPVPEEVHEVAEQAKDIQAAAAAMGVDLPTQEQALERVPEDMRWLAPIYLEPNSGDILFLRFSSDRKCYDICIINLDGEENSTETEITDFLIAKNQLRSLVSEYARRIDGGQDAPTPVVYDDGKKGLLFVGIGHETVDGVQRTYYEIINERAGKQKRAKGILGDFRDANDAQAALDAYADEKGLTQMVVEPAAELDPDVETMPVEEPLGLDDAEEAGLI
jgi:hypothetical protein